MNRELEARLKISAVDKTGRVLQNIGQKLTDVNRRAAAFNRQQGLIAATTNEAFTMLSRYAAPAALTYGLVTATKDFAALERQMTRIGITAGASAEQTAEAFKVAQQVAKDLKYDSVQPAIDALDTLTASGKTLEEAMGFLPSVLATAQASGAATNDIANTGLKAASALKIEASELQNAFDIMVAGGKAGQFELKDMAQYIPNLANSFASLGYEGEDGLKRLIAMLQTLREDTGDASSAANQAQNIFGKIYSEETANKFKDFGINLRKEMEAAKKAGDDTLTAFLKITEKALNGDMTKLPLLFSDQEFRLGMQSLLSSEESFRKFMDAVNSAEVSGTVFRDLERVTSDTQASVDSLSNSWGKLMTSIGEGVAQNGGVAAMDAISGSIDYHTAVNRGLEKKGVSGFWDRTKFGLSSSQLEKDRMAIAGGYNDPAFVADVNQRLYESGQVKASTGRQNQGVVLAEFPGASGTVPVPGQKPGVTDRLPALPQHLTGLPPGLTPITAPPVASMGQVGPLPQKVKDFVGNLRPSAESRASFREAMGIDLHGWKTADRMEQSMKLDGSDLATTGEEAGKKVAEGGREAGKEIEASASFIRIAGYDVSGAIERAAEKLLDAAGAINRMPSVGAGSQPSRPAVNADTGRSMPPATFGPQ